jgi:hypothetical protein
VAENPRHFHNEAAEGGSSMDLFNTSRQRTLRQWLVRIGAVVAGLTMMVFGLKEYRATSRLQSAGELAEIQPIDGYTQHKRRGSTTYTAQITFETSKGRKVSQRHSIPKDALDELEHGATVRVRYDPDSPSQFVFEHESAEWLPAAMGAGFLALGLFLL